MTLDGLSKADSSAVELVPGPFKYAADASNFVKTVEVPAGVPLAKLSVFSADERADFDMVVVTPSGQAIVVATASASESVSIPNPAPGTYRMFVNLYDSPNGQATKASVDAAVLGANVGNATVTPDPVRLANGKAGSSRCLEEPGARLLHRPGHVRRCQRTDLRQRRGDTGRRRGGSAGFGRSEEEEEEETGKGLNDGPDTDYADNSSLGRSRIRVPSEELPDSNGRRLHRRPLLLAVR